MQIGFLGREDPLEKEMETCCSIPAWKIPQKEEPGGYSPCDPKGLDQTKHKNNTHKYIHTVLLKKKILIFCQEHEDIRACAFKMAM